MKVPILIRRDGEKENLHFSSIQLLRTREPLYHQLLTSCVFFSNNIDCFCELSGEEKKNIGKAKEQFKVVSDEITQYVTKYSAFPERNFN